MRRYGLILKLQPQVLEMCGGAEAGLGGLKPPEVLVLLLHLTELVPAAERLMLFFCVNENRSN